VEECSSRAVRFERSLQSENKRKISSYSGRRLRKVSFGCLTRTEEDELSEATDSLLLMRFEDLVAGLAERDGMKRFRVPNREYIVLVAAVSKYTGVVTVLDALTSDIITEIRTTEVEYIFSVAAF
jgi:hypothetical protein